MTAILDYLAVGSHSAKHLNELCRLTGKNERVIRQEIEMLRADGAVICSDERGYFLPETVDELRTYVRQERARVRSLHRRNAAAFRLLREWGQVNG